MQDSSRPLVCTIFLKCTTPKADIRFLWILRGWICPAQYTAVLSHNGAYLEFSLVPRTYMRGR